MKAILAVLTFCCASALAQRAPSNLLLESRAAHVSITFAGQDSTTYRFAISSSSNVTALALRLVPFGTPKVNGAYACDVSCSGSSRIGSKGKPVIKAGGRVDDFVFDIAEVTAKAVVVESAVFDDGTFEGDEKVAAFMSATQIGNQGEWERIVPSVTSSLNSNLDDVSRAQQIHSQLRKLPDSIDSAMIKSFKLRFPFLPDCNQQYAQTMKGATVAEKRLVLESLESFTSGLLPGVSTLRQWWDKTRDTLDSFGCAGCATVAPRVPAPVNADYRSCNQGTTQDPQSAIPVIFILETAELTPDDIASDAPATPAATSAPAPPSTVRPANTAVDKGGSYASSADAPRTTPVPPPRPVSSIEPASAQPLASDQAFGLLFQHLKLMDETDAQYEAKGISLSGYRTFDQRAAGLNDDEAKKLKQAAQEYNQAEAKLFAAILDFHTRYPQDFLLMPPPPEYRRLEDERIKVLKSRIQYLQSGLGDSSFRKLNNYVRRLDQPSAPPVRPFSANDVFSRYMTFVAQLEELAAKYPAAGKNGSVWRTREQRATGLDLKQWATLKQVADDYQQARKKLSASLPVVMGGAAAPVPAQSSSPQVHVQPAAQLQSTRPAAPSTAPITTALNFAEAQNQLVKDHVEQLQKKLGKPAFEKLSKYLQWTYNPFIPQQQECVTTTPGTCTALTSAAKAQTRTVQVNSR